MTETPSSYGAPEEAAARFSRVFAAAGCTTQAELAAVLNIRQSSISDAKRRGRVPSDWLIKLLRLRGVNPDWIVSGTGPVFLIAPGREPKDTAGPGEAVPPVRSADALIVKRVLRCFPDHDLASELRRRERAPELKK